VDDHPGLHRLLARQLARVGADLERPPPDPEGWRELVQRVDRAYRDSDSDRYTVERSLDISSREMAELHARLTAERDTLTAVLAAVRSAVLELDPVGRVRYCNEAARRLFAADPIGGSLADLLELVGPDGPVSPAAVLATGASVHQPDGLLHRRADRARIEVAWTFTPLRGERALQGFVVTLTDLSEQKQAQRELNEARVDAEVARRTERTRAQFLANMSHELRTPLTAIIGYAEMLRDDGPDPDGLDRILRSSRHLLALINDVLDLSKVDAGRMELLLEEVDVASVIEEVAATVRPVAEQRGNTVRTEIPADLPPIRTDRLRLLQCVQNLISNAAKFTRQGRIDVAARVDGRWVEIAVRDTGIGIPAKALGRLFQPFVQVDSSTTRTYGGTGLGLALTRAIVERLGGSVGVESVEGRGSTFALRVPTGPPAPR
jgi:signal transduction histidine kinase